MFHIIGQLIVGLIIGAIARFLLPGKEAIASGMLGWLITALIGMGGAFVGTFIGRFIWGTEKYAVGWIMSIIGAMLLVVLVRFIT
ncbi:MAG: GlsB/YeaQ/YmgE family stress response membrane protein [Acidobacteria bacterium]|nr:GlsB/YeaQ/YmgE family stress response membrane protein [Acidobacteriota bacterium]